MDDYVEATLERRRQAHVSKVARIRDAMEQLSLYIPTNHPYLRGMDLNDDQLMAWYNGLMKHSVLHPEAIKAKIVFIQLVNGEDFDPTQDGYLFATW